MIGWGLFATLTYSHKCPCRNWIQVTPEHLNSYASPEVDEAGETLASRVDELLHIPSRLGASQSNTIFPNGPATCRRRERSPGTPDQLDAVAASGKIKNPMTRRLRFGGA